MFIQGIIDATGTEGFAKEPKFPKLLRELKSTPLKKFTGFPRISL